MPTSSATNPMSGTPGQRDLDGPAGDDLPTRRDGGQLRRQCSVDDCDRPHQARGYCLTHYKQWRAPLDELPDSTPPPGTFTTDDIARLADVAPRTVTNWPALGRIPPPDGHASGRPWWHPDTLPTLSRRRRRPAPHAGTE